MRFPYQTIATLRPVYPLGGIRVRHIPAVTVSVGGPLGDRGVDCRLDAGADERAEDYNRRWLRAVAALREAGEAR